MLGRRWYREMGIDISGYFRGSWGRVLTRLLRLFVW